MAWRFKFSVLVLLSAIQQLTVACAAGAVQLKLDYSVAPTAPRRPHWAKATVEAHISRPGLAQRSSLAGDRLLDRSSSSDVAKKRWKKGRPVKKKSKAQRLTELRIAQCQDTFDDNDGARDSRAEETEEGYPGADASVAMCLVVREQDDDILEV